MKLKQILQHKLTQTDSFSLRQNIVIIGVFLLCFSISSSFILSSYFKQQALSSLVSISQPPSVEAKSLDQPQQFQAQQNKNSTNTLTNNTSNQPFPEKINTSSLPELSANSVLVKDHRSGKVLLEKNSQRQRPLASITKLMSALVFLETDPDWDKKVTIVKNDIVGTHVDQGEVYTTQELWSASLIGSSNKSILSLAHSVGWPKQAFIQRMNQKASELGMDDTYFAGTTGLEKSSVSTAEDISILLKESLKQKKIQSALATKEYTLDYKDKQHHIWNTDWLLLDWIPHDFKRVYGGKTGYIEAAGYNFTVQLSNGEGRILDIVVLGADSHEDRFKVARDAAEWVYENYEWEE